MRCNESTSTEPEKMREQLERLVELLSAYSSSVLTGRLLEEATGGELTHAQLDAMTFIQRHGGCSAKALSEGLRISIPSATRLVDRLVLKGMVDRHESGVDRRLIEVYVTATGVDALSVVQRTRIDRFQHALAAFKPEDRETLLRLMEDFLRVVLCDEQTVEDCCRHCGDEHDGGCVVNTAHLALVGRPIEHP
ncbi:MAG: MarR family winged helix-turn-helix transcriptional regulator [Armatimonadota bacterium]